MASCRVMYPGRPRCLPGIGIGIGHHATMFPAMLAKMAMARPTSTIAGMETATTDGVTDVTEVKRYLMSLAGACVLASTLPVLAHDAANLEHTHAFQQTAYGTWREGHAVNGPQGNIIIWSPRTISGYQSAPSLRFARPEPIAKAPRSPFDRPKAGREPASHGVNKNERD